MQFISSTTFNMFIAFLGGLGIGSILNSIVVDFLSIKKEKHKHKYEQAKEVYIGILGAIHNVAISPSKENLKGYGLWALKCEILGSQEVATYAKLLTSEKITDEDYQKIFSLLIESMRKDLQKKM